MLLNRNTGFRLRGLSLPLGQWGKVRFFSRSTRCWEKTVLVIQNDLKYNKECLRAYNRGHSKHNCARNNR